MVGTERRATRWASCRVGSASTSLRERRNEKNARSAATRRIIERLGLAAVHLAGEKGRSSRVVIDATFGERLASGRQAREQCEVARIRLDRARRQTRVRARCSCETRSMASSSSMPGL
jgi:hypothetical protein